MAVFKFKKLSKKPAAKKPARRKPAGNVASKVVSAVPPDTELVTLAGLVFDEKYQHRKDIPPVDEYVRVLEDSEGVWPFPPLLVRKVRGKHCVLSGFTRGRAALAHGGFEQVPCVVMVCSEDEAMKQSLKANTTHGYRLTNADKRKSVLFACGRWPDSSTRTIAAICGVSHTYVEKMLNQLKDQEEADPKEFEEANAGPAMLALGVCPACSVVDSWIEKDDGTVRCAACSHVHGEPSTGTADDDKEVAEALAKGDAGKGKSKSKADPVAEPVGDQAADSTGNVASAGAVSRFEMLKKAESDLGRFIRAMSDAGWVDGVESMTTDILIALKKAMKECR